MLENYFKITKEVGVLDIIKIYFSKLCVPNPQSKFTCLGKSSKFIPFKFPIFDKFLYFF